MTISLLFWAFVAVSAIQSIYYVCFSSILFHGKNKNNEKEPMPVSVIICAKNEAKNIKRFLPSIINQHYSNFEIVLINDASSDNTLKIMRSFKGQNPKIKIVDVANNNAFWGSKKYALTLGIKAAENECLLFTDADCTPFSKHWISEMVQSFSEKKTIILGYGKHQTEGKSLLNKLVRFETLLTAIQYFSYAKLGSPYMGVGRNLAYKKSTFFKVNGFIKHVQIQSGDDDLFIQDAATKTNTAICLEPNGFTVSEAPKSYKEWFHQKRRHISTVKYYTYKHQLLLGLFYLSKVFFYISAITSLFFFSWKPIISILSFYFVVQFLIIGLIAKKLKEPQIIYLLPFLEICLLLFQFIIFIANKISKPTTWK
jgi:glycosyltransferase involved in cell wall biosynthesis